MITTKLTAALLVALSTLLSTTVVEARRTACPTVAAAEAPACVKHTIIARFAEKVSLTQPDANISLEVFARNTDSCSCPETCFTVASGYHPPHDSTNMLRMSNPLLRKRDGSLQPSYICLDPGEEASFFWTSTVDSADNQEPPSFLTPNIWFDRTDVQDVTYEDFLLKYYDAEGPAICYGYTYEECRAKVYEPAPPR